MPAFKAPDFNERAAAARDAKQRALEKLRAKPAPDPAVVAARLAAAEARDAAAAERRAAKLAAEAAKAEARAQAAAEAKAAEEAAQAAKVVVPQKTEAERKAERDARYAARKARKR